MIARTIHNYTIGAYTPGRHGSNLPAEKTVNISAEQLAIYWFSYSQWNQAFKDRKSQITTQIDENDKKFNFGREHHADEIELEERRQLCLQYTHDINEKSALIFMR